MGSLALWRTLEGLGKGVSAGAESRHQKELQQAETDRMMRLEQMRIQAANENAKMQDTTRRDLAAQDAAVQVHLSGERMSQDERQHTASMTARAQQHEESMAAQRERTDVARGQLTLAQENANRERYQVFQTTEKVPVGEQQLERMDGESDSEYAQRSMMHSLTTGGPGIYESKTKVMRFDRDTGNLEEQVNGEWRPAALEGAEKMLFENPGKWREYQQVHGELPGWFQKLHPGKVPSP